MTTVFDRLDRYPWTRALQKLPVRWRVPRRLEAL